MTPNNDFYYLGFDMKLTFFLLYLYDWSSDSIEIVLPEFFLRTPRKKFNASFEEGFKINPGDTSILLTG